MSLLLLFNQNNGVIAGSLIVTDTADIVAFTGTFPISGAITTADIPDSVSLTGLTQVISQSVPPSLYDYGWYRGRPNKNRRGWKY